MPAKNIIKEYIENGYYHIYNRGVEKRLIFLDDKVCTIFLFYLKVFLSPIEEVKNLLSSSSMLNSKVLRLLSSNLSKEIDLLSFSLMPNHFHFEVKQYTKDAIIKLMRRITTSYVMYFNRKYNRVGSLFQNRYKACLINSDQYLLWLSRYIHLNSQDTTTPINFNNYSSYNYYLGQKSANWVKPQEILNYFHSSKMLNKNDLLSYQSFVESHNQSLPKSFNSLLLEDAPQ